MTEPKQRRRATRPGEGRPPHVPDDESRAKVKFAIGLGASEDAVARRLGIAPKTMRKHYRKELDTAMEDFKAMALESAGLKVAEGNVAMLIFLMKTRWGFRETLDVGGNNGGPIRYFITSDDERL